MRDGLRTALATLRDAEHHSSYDSTLRVLVDDPD
jgi:hypothetical protein